MAKFGILSGDRVINLILADTLEEAQVLGEAVELTADNPFGINWIRNNATGKFILPSEGE